MQCDLQLSRHPSTEITEEAAKYPEIYCEWAPNEKVALEVAHGTTVVVSECLLHEAREPQMWAETDPFVTIS